MDGLNVTDFSQLSGNALSIAILFFFIRYFINREEKQETRHVEREAQRETTFIKREEVFQRLLEENTEAIKELASAVSELRKD
jgi:hypothetical protein